MLLVLYLRALLTPRPRCNEVNYLIRTLIEVIVAQVGYVDIRGVAGTAASTAKIWHKKVGVARVLATNQSRQNAYKQCPFTAFQ